VAPCLSGKKYAIFSHEVFESGANVMFVITLGSPLHQGQQPGYKEAPSLKISKCKSAEVTEERHAEKPQRGADKFRIPKKYFR
jgi:hypothetical protein